MDLEELHSCLKQAYSDKNLNRITAELIELYKTKNHQKIRVIANLVSKHIEFHEENISKCFSRLIMLYHPDKGEYFRIAIKKSYDANDMVTLSSFAHIFSLADIDQVSIAEIDENIDYQPEYVWDEPETEGYYLHDETELRIESNFEDLIYEKSFINEVKYRVYGNINIVFPPHYLEDYENFEMVDSGLVSIDGVQYCKHAKTFDFSDNNISNISDLFILDNLEEIYLANNEIGYIDALSNLTKLRIVDISGNYINDISPLFNLDNLEYVNVINNPISLDQCHILMKKGIILMH